MGRHKEHPRKSNSVRVCISKAKDPDILQIVKAGYSLNLLASYACYAHAGLFPPLKLKGVDVNDMDIKRARAGIHFTPENVSKPVYEELKDLDDYEISVEIKKYIRENIIIEKRPAAVGLSAGQVGGDWS